MHMHDSFAKEPYKRDDILQKRPLILRSLLIEATPYLLFRRRHIGRLLKMIGLFCKGALWKRGYSAKETYDFYDLRSLPISSFYTTSYWFQRSFFSRSIFFPDALYDIVLMYCTGWWRPIGCLIFIGHFPQKSPMISGTFAGKILRLEASCGSLPPCTRNGVATISRLLQIIGLFCKRAL